MLNALMPGTCVPVHRHPVSNENVICVCGKLVEILYEEVDDTIGFEQGMDAQEISQSGKSFNPSRASGQAKLRTGCLRESARYMLDPSVGNFGCVVPVGVWHTVEVLEPSVIYEAKDGKYGEDGSENLKEFIEKSSRKSSSADIAPLLPNSISDLKKNIEYLNGMECQSGSMDAISPLCVKNNGITQIDGEIDRILIGNYPLSEDYGKRPLAKLYHDIAKELGVIK